MSISLFTPDFNYISNNTISIIPYIYVQTETGIKATTNTYKT